MQSDQCSCSRPWWLSWMHIRLVIRSLRVQPLPGQQHSFVEIGHEIFSSVILSLPLTQEGQFPVSDERMCTILVNCLVDLAYPVNLLLDKLTLLNMTPLGCLGCKTSTQINRCHCHQLSESFNYIGYIKKEKGS